jgi:3-isopropylmalate dehydrogenase
MAFELARLRRRHAAQQPVVMSMDKANVMETSRAWREIMEELAGTEYTDVLLRNVLADNAAMEVAARPHTLDVVAGDHLFGGIAQGIAAGLTAPGLVPAGWLNGRRQGVFRPARPEGMDNAYGSIMSASAALRYSLDMPAEADRVDSAVGQALADGIRTPDLGGTAEAQEVTAAVIASLQSKDA